MSDDPGVLLKLPDDLHYLIGPAMKYGRYQFDHHVFDFLDRATDGEMAELAAVAERVLLRDDYPRVNAFLDENEIAESEAAARLYFLFLVLDHAGLQFDW